MSISPLLIRTPVTGFRVHPDPILIPLNRIICAKTLFPRSRSRMTTQGVGTSMKLSGGHVSTHDFFFILIDISIWLHQVLAAACRIGNRLLSSHGAGALDCMGSVAAVPGLSCPAA